MLLLWSVFKRKKVFFFLNILHLLFFLLAELCGMAFQILVP